MPTLSILQASPNVGEPKKGGRRLRAPHYLGERVMPLSTLFELAQELNPATSDGRCVRAPGCASKVRPFWGLSHVFYTPLAHLTCALNSIK